MQTYKFVQFVTRVAETLADATRRVPAVMILDSKTQNPDYARSILAV